VHTQPHMDNVQRQNSGGWHVEWNWGSPMNRHAHVQPTKWVAAGVPPALVFICLLLIWEPSLEWTDLDVVELFSGTAAITNACATAGLRSHGYDVEDPQAQAPIRSTSKAFTSMQRDTRSAHLLRCGIPHGLRESEPASCEGPPLHEHAQTERDGVLCLVASLACFQSHAKPACFEWWMFCAAAAERHLPAMRSRLAVQMTLCIVSGGLLWAAPVCSSWVFMSRGSTGRSATTPLGSSSSKSATEGNIMAGRCAALAMLAALLNVKWCIEQPITSLMPKHPRMQQLWAAQTVWRASVAMGAYGARSMKRMYVWCNHKAVGVLQTKTERVEGDPSVVTHYVDSHGKARVVGGPGLKQTQSEAQSHNR